MTDKMSVYAKCVSALAAALAFAGCGGTGTVTVAVWGEGFAEEGIPAEEVSDGWAISFERAVVSLGEVELRQDADGEPEASEAAFRQVDVTKASNDEGHALFTAEVGTGTYDDVRWRIGGPDAQTTPALHVVGSATKGGVTKTFDWAFDNDTRYIRCESTADVPSNGEARILLTLHLDHLFFDSLVDEEPGIAFDLIASADADDDGAVTEAELRAVDIRTQDRYGVGSTGITDLWSYLRYQATNVGHIDGEGHCDAERIR